MKFLKKKKRLSKEEKQQLLEKVFDLVAYDPEARQLLQMAQEEGIRIGFNESIADNAAAIFIVSSSQEKPYIDLNPYYADGKEANATALASSLVHELRHYWQYKELGINNKNFEGTDRSPRLSFILNRVTEADAYAFQCRFLKIVNEKGEATKNMVERITDLRTKDPTADIENIYDEEYEKVCSSPAERREYLKEQFIAALKGDTLRYHYDVNKAFSLHYKHTAEGPMPNFNRPDLIPDLKVSDMKRLLREDISAEAAPYIDEMTDREFENLVLVPANRNALQAVTLMEKFRGAVFMMDGQKAITLRHRAKSRLLDAAEDAKYARSASPATA